MAGTEVGTLMAKVVPNAEGFHAKLRRDLAKIGDLEIPVKPDMDMFHEELVAGLKKAAESVHVEVAVSADTSGVVRELERVSKDRSVTVEAEADTASAARQLERVSKDRSATIEAEADTASANKQIDWAARRRKALIEVETRHDKAWGKALPALGNLTRSLTTVSALAGSATVAVAGVAPSVAAVGVAAAQATIAVGGLAAAMAPAALGAAALSVGVLKTAFKDMGAAAGEATQQANTALTSMKASLSDVGKQAQESFWAGFSNFGQLSALIAPVGAALNGVASSMGQAAANFTAFVTAGVGLGAFNTILGNSAIGASNLSMALSNALKGVTLFGAVGAPLFAQLTAKVNELAAAWSQRMVTAFQDGTMQAWFDSAIAKVQSFWGVLQNLGGIVSGVFQAMAAAGGGVASVFADVIEKTNQWVNSGPGMAAMTGFFRDMQSAVASLAPVIGKLADIIITQLAPIMADVFQTLAPYAKEALDNISQALDALAPAIPDIAKAFGDLAVAVTDLLVPLAHIIDFISPIAPILVPAAAAMLAFGGAVKGVNAAAKGFTAVKDAAQTISKIPVVGNAAKKALNGLKNALKGVASWAKDAPKAFADFGKIVGGPFKKGLSLAADAAKSVGKALLNLATKTIPKVIGAIGRMSIAFLTTPVGAVIAGIALLVGGLVWFFTQTETGRQAWQSFCDTMVNAWNWVKDKVSAGFDVLKEKFGQFMDFLAPIKDAFNAGGIAGVVGLFWDTIVQGFQAGMAKLGEFGAMIWGWVTQQWTAFTTWLSGLWTSFTTWLTTMWTGFTTWLSGLWTSFTTWLSGLWTSFTTWLGTLWTGFTTWLQGLWTGLVTWLTEAWTSFTTWITGLWTSFTTWLGELWNGFIIWLQGLWTAVVTWLTEAWTAFTTWLTNLWTSFTAWISQLWAGFIGWLQGAWDALVGWLQGAWQSITGALSSLWEWIKQTAQNAWNSLLATCQSVWESIKSYLQQKWDEIKSAAGSAWDAIKERIRSAWESIKSAVSQAVQAVVQKMHEFAQGIQNGVQRAIAFCSQLPGKIRSIFSSAGSWLVSAGANIMRGLLNGISSMVGAVIGKIKSVAGQIKSAFTGLLGIHSPSRVFMGYGENLAEGLAIGVDDKATVAESSAQNLAATTDQALDAALPKSKTFTPEVTAKDASVKATPIDSVEALGKTVQKAYRSAIQPAARGIGNAMSKMGSNVVSATLGQAAPSMVQMANTSAQTANTVTQNTVGTISTAFTQTGRTIANTQQTQIEPAFRATRESVVQTANTFGPATGLIARQWDAVRPATANPARFVINEVFNGGIVGMWNSVSELLGTKKMSNYVARFATGGYVSGPGGPTDDKIPAMLSNGEYVIKADTVRKVGVSALDSLNNGGAHRYPGVVGGRTGKEMYNDMTFRKVAIRRQGGGIAEGTPAWHALKRGYDWARSRNGRPYVWGGSANGAGGTDCSGFMSGIADVILGGDGRRQWATMSFPGSQRGSWDPGLAAGFSVGYFNGGPWGGHTAGTIGGVVGMPAANVESGGRNSRVKFGTSDAAGADHPQFTNRFHLKYVEGGGFVGSSGGGLSTADMVKSMIEPKKKALLDKVKAYSVPGLIGTLPQMTASKLIGAVETKTKKLAEEVGSSGGPIPPGTGAERWRDMAKRAMARVGFNANDERQVNAMIKQIQSESGGDPGVAQRIHDVNGTGESAGVGLLQIIPGTFAANRDPALPNDRRDPFANMVAALRYYKGRYGNDLTTMWGHGHGYDMGGWLQPGMNTTYNGFSKPEAILTPSESEAFVGVARRFNEDGGAGASYTGQHIENQYVVDPADIAWRTERGVKRAMREESIRV